MGVACSSPGPVLADGGPCTRAAVSKADAAQAGKERGARACQKEARESAPVFDINASSPTTSALLLPCASVPYGLDAAASVKSLDSGGKPGGVRAEDSPTLRNLLQLACTVLNAQSATVAAPSREAVHCVGADGLTLLGAGPRARPGAAARLGACRAAAAPSSATLVDGPLSRPDGDRDVFAPGAPRVAFYIGAELASKAGGNLGMLCVADARPLHAEANTQVVVASMGQLVSRELEHAAALLHAATVSAAAAAAVGARVPWRPAGVFSPLPASRSLPGLDADGGAGRARARAAASAARRPAQRPGAGAAGGRPAACETEARLLVDTRGAGWPVLHANELARRDLLQEEGHAIACFWDAFDLGDDCQAPWERFAAPLERGEDFVVRRARLRAANGDLTCGDWDLHFRLMRPGSPYLAQAAGGVARCEAGVYAVLLQWAPARNSATGQLSAGSQRSSTSSRRSLQRVGSLELPVFPGLELGPLLGQGSYGRVYRGIYDGRTIAVKVVENTAMLRMQDGQPLEAVIMAGLAHPSIVHTIAHSVVPAKDIEAWDSAHEGAASEAARKAQTRRAGSAKHGNAWLLLEFMDRGCLQEAIRRGAFLRQPSSLKGKCNLAMVLATAAEIAAGMAFLHARGIIHGDLSGANIMLQSCATSPHGFRAKVADFGLARNIVTSRIETDSLGTITHMPPELLSNGILSKSVDIYAFGVLLWEMCNGMRAWEGLSQAQVVFAVAIQMDGLQFPPTANPAIAGLASACMARDPAQRPTFVQLVARIAAMQGKAPRTPRAPHTRRSR